MTRYKLSPALLAELGKDLDGELLWSGCAGAVKTYDFALHGVSVRISTNTEVAEVVPPIPAEPEPGAYLIGGVLVVRFRAPAGWTAWCWQADAAVGVCESDSWDGVWAEIGEDLTADDIHPLVPSSSVRAELPEVELPWTGSTSGGNKIVVHAVDADGDVRVEWPADREYMRRDTALGMAAALIAAVGMQRCARCGTTGVPLPHGPSDMLVCDPCNAAVDTEVAPAPLDLPWQHRDGGGDSVEIGATRDASVAYVQVTETQGGHARTTRGYLDTHEARMGAVAAIRAVDEAIGGAE